MGKILKRCERCGQFHAAYRVRDERGQTLRLCYSCWKARTDSATAAERDCRAEPAPAADAAATQGKPHE